MSQPVQACEPGLGDLSKPTAPAYFFGVKLMFVGVVLMFVGVMNFGQVQKIRFFMKIFWSNSYQFLAILVRSSKLTFLAAPLKLRYFKDFYLISILCLILMIIL